MSPFKNGPTNCVPRANNVSKEKSKVVDGFIFSIGNLKKKYLITTKTFVGRQPSLVIIGRRNDAFKLWINVCIRSSTMFEVPLLVLNRKLGRLIRRTNLSLYTKVSQLGLRGKLPILLQKALFIQVINFFSCSIFSEARSFTRSVHV